MMARSRLGKGLGALFPALPNEEEMKVEAPVPDDLEVPTQTPASSKKETHAKKESTAKSPHATKHSKRASVPALGDLTHPSDFFFGPQSGAASGASAASSADSFASQLLNTVDQRKIAAAPGQADVEAARKAASADVSRETSGSIASAASSASSSAGASGKTQGDQNDQPSDPLKPVSGGYLAELKLADIGPNDHQPRTIFDEDDLLELSDSIKEVGVLQPIVVRRRPKAQIAAAQAAKAAAANAPDSDVSRETSKGGIFADRMDSPYEIIMGERRWRASQLAGLKTIPAIVKTTSDDDMLRDALLENLHRVALNPLEEAAAYQQMIKEFGLTQEQLAKSVSKSRPQIANMLRLLQLPPAVQKKVASGVLSAGHARALLGLDSAEEMDKLAVRIVGEGLSVRSTEEIVAMMTKAAADQEDKPKAPRRANVWTGSPIQQSLENRFETKVAIKGTRKHGRIEITFSSPEDMERIMALLNPEAPSSDGWV
ncbi:ParB/RepB/Spo0J family partition protein [Bifidobacterium vespertilionis]|uniref:ParB/RepB/Spo0J family partition protein n=2 Tax=Bifidobacterium vespertilionis TaxID=2562524 RepID=A0A5J5E1Q9_9BIFI|nr:ParB/RepB/Spo0J family partition protein [Bifidobacterium vespertilionis]KAA8818659.1 ParB/RepB/Spo0J family partition protein [Bifidobacterium vespertilionis]KAA8823114.1 ParB/RepB/Spo0J family partition protein [Bifidobacterium vespertilionis]